MPKVAEIKVGTRNREATSHSINLLFDWDDLFDSDGEFYALMVQKGLILSEGEDYEVLDSDGNVASLKSAPEKVRKLIVVEVAERLNCPTSVKVPDGGAHVASTDRAWVAFRPRLDTKFETEEARQEYIARNK